MSTPVVRRAKKEDIPIIVGFNQSMALETEGITLDTQKLYKGVEFVFKNETAGFYIVCEIDGDVKACLMITFEWSDWRNGTFWWIQSVYVSKEYRKLGLYKQMYSFIKTLVEEDNKLVGIRLYVDRENILAQKVYSKLGMEKSNYHMFEYSKNKIHA